jgi:Methylglyoxal synthase
MIKTIALVAHDSRKKEMLEWAAYNMNVLSRFELYATGTTGRLLQELFTNKQHNEIKHINRLLSGPLGGDAQISAMIAEGKIDCLVFFCDNLIIQGHNSDVQGLSRLASLYNIAYAPNRTTADMIISSSLLENNDYNIIVPLCIDGYTNRNINQ